MDEIELPRRMKFWGWGYEDMPETPPQLIANMESYFSRFFNVDSFNTLPPPQIREIEIRKPRIEIPERLRAFCTNSREERIRHALGRGFHDFVKIFSREYENPPDVVAYARNEQDIVDVMDWAIGVNAAVIPYGGGTSVVGGVEPDVGGGFDGVITLNISLLNRVLEVDDISHCARIQAGAAGPDLEAQLRPHGFALRHYPQSFQHSTLGGWISVRSAGHFATRYTHVDDLVESIRLVTPRGPIETRRLPGDGTGPDPNRLFMGSEGTLGVITEAWMRLQPRPTHRASIAVFFDDFLKGSDAVRGISQAGLYPSNLRIIGAEEARVNFISDKNKDILFIAFESADHPVDEWMNRSLEICADYGGEFDRDVLRHPDSHKKGEQGRWRDIFIETGYYREIATPREIIYGTIDTSITWERFPDFYHKINEVTATAMEEATGRQGSLSCRFVYVYPDGPAPYWSFYCLGEHGALLEQWRHVKDVANSAFLACGGGTTHHSAIGRVHKKWFDEQTPSLFKDVLASAKRELDAHGILNPGVLFGET